MSEITFYSFKRDLRTINFILFLIVLMGIILSFAIEIESLLPGFYPIFIVCILANVYFGIKAKRMLYSPNLRMNWFEREVIQSILITVLGIGTIYLFFYEGLYGIYLLIKSFSFVDLLYRLIIIVLSGKLAFSVANIQDALKWLSNNSWK